MEETDEIIKWVLRNMYEFKRNPDGSGYWYKPVQDQCELPKVNKMTTKGTKDDFKSMSMDTVSIELPRMRKATPAGRNEATEIFKDRLRRRIKDAIESED